MTLFFMDEIKYRSIFLTEEECSIISNFVLEISVFKIIFSGEFFLSVILVLKLSFFFTFKSFKVFNTLVSWIFITSVISIEVSAETSMLITEVIKIQDTSVLNTLNDLKVKKKESFNTKITDKKNSPEKIILKTEISKTKLEIIEHSSSVKKIDLYLISSIKKRVI